MKRAGKKSGMSGKRGGRERRLPERVGYGILNGSGIWKRAVSFLACLVIFVTTYAMILPAVTLEKENTNAIGIVTEEEIPTDAEAASETADIVSAADPGDMDFDRLETDHAVLENDFSGIPAETETTAADPIETAPAAESREFPGAKSPLVCDTDNYTAYACFESDAGLSADTVFLLSPVAETDSLKYRNAAAAELNRISGANAEISGSAFYRAAFTGENGEEIPAAPVDIRIEYKNNGRSHAGGTVYAALFADKGSADAAAVIFTDKNADGSDTVRIAGEQITALDLRSCKFAPGCDVTGYAAVTVTNPEKISLEDAEKADEAVDDTDAAPADETVNDTNAEQTDEITANTGAGQTDEASDVEQIIESAEHTIAEETDGTADSPDVEKADETAGNTDEEEAEKTVGNTDVEEADETAGNTGVEETEKTVGNTNEEEADETAGNTDEEDADETAGNLDAEQVDGLAENVSETFTDDTSEAADTQAKDADLMTEYEESEEGNEKTAEDPAEVTADSAAREEALDGSEEETDPESEEPQDEEQETVTWVSPYDLAGNAKSWVQNAELLVENTNGQMVVPTSNTNNIEIPEYAKFSIKIPFKAPAAGNDVGFGGLKPGDKIVYTIPDWVRKLDVESGSLTVGGENAGEWKIENNQVIITLNNTFITKNPYGLSGSIELSGSMEATTTTETGTKKIIDFLGYTVNTVVKKRTGGVLNIDIQKVFKGETSGKSGPNCGERSSAKYELTIFAGDLTGKSQRNNSDLEEIVIDDFFTVKEKYAFMNVADFNQNDDLKKYITYTNISAKIYDHNGAEVTDRMVIVVDNDTTDAKAQFKVMNSAGNAFSVLHPDEKVIITYDAEISKEMYEYDPRGPWREASDQQDEFGWNTKVNGVDGSSGSSKNTSPIQGATNQNRSWVERRAENGAEVKTKSLTEPKQATTKKADGSNKDPLDFNKTWLWKNGDPQTNYTSNYQVSVNEAPIMNITGWTFRDPIGNAQNGQTIISDVKVTRNGADYETISLADLQKSGGVSSGNAMGSKTDEIVYVFPDNANYRFFYTARYKNPSGENKIECKNSATLTEPGDDGDTYGVYESHTVKGATVTKRLDYMDVGEGVIRWQTTIDEGIGVVNGSVYKDFLGWIRKPKGGSNVESTLKSNDNDHTVDLNKLKLEITSGEGDDMVVIPADKYKYSVEEMSPEEISTSRLVNDQYNGVRDWNVRYGFKIIFNQSYPGPIRLHYSTVADFQNVAWEEEFINKFTFQKEPAPTTEQPYGSYIFYDSVGASYQQHSTLNKVAESISDADVPVIKWHLSINTQKYNASKLKVVDTIPAGLEFDLLRDLQVRWVENGEGASASTLDDWKEAYTGDRNAPYDSWPTKTANNEDNKYFTATFDSNTRKLEIVLKDIAFKKVEFNVYTQPMLSQLSDGQSHEYENTAEVWTASETQNNVKLQSASAKSSISYTFAGKDVVYNEETAPNAEYKIEVNKGGIDLNPKGDRFIVTDEAVKDSTLRFKVPETLVVRKKDGTQLTLNEDPYSEIKSNEVRLTAIGDSSFSLDVPDNTPLVIEYKAFVPGVVGENVDLSNSVILTAENEQIFTRTLMKSEAVQKSSVTVDAANRIQIRKGSTGENAVLLDGAEFAIYDVTEKNNQEYSIENLSPVGTLTTGVKNADGSYAVGFGLASTYLPTKSTQIQLDNFKIYKVVETKAPEGYKTPVGEDAVAGMFVFVTEEPPEGIDAEAYIEQIQNYRTAGIQVINKNYTDFTFYKSNEPDLTSVSVTKQWLDKEGNVRTNYEEGEGTVTFALMRHVDGQDDTQVGENREIKYESGTWQTVTIGELPKVENGKAITYYVKELTPDPARDDLKVTYRLGENGAEQSDPVKAATVFTADSSTITIINRNISVDIQLVKIDETTRSSQNKRYLGGAEFTLYRLQKTSAEGKIDYVVYPNTTDSVKTSDVEGGLTFTGLPDGKYRISETHVPAGYVKYEKEDIFFTIDGGEVHWTDKDGSAITSQSLVSYDSTYKTFTIGNQPGVELPSTGGPGKWLFTILGSLLVLGAGVMLVRKRWRLIC